MIQKTRAMSRFNRAATDRRRPFLSTRNHPRQYLSYSRSYETVDDNETNHGDSDYDDQDKKNDMHLLSHPRNDNCAPDGFNLHSSAHKTSSPSPSPSGTGDDETEGQEDPRTEVLFRFTIKLDHEHQQRILIGFPYGFVPSPTPFAFLCDDDEARNLRKEPVFADRVVDCPDIGLAAATQKSPLRQLLWNMCLRYKKWLLFAISLLAFVVWLAVSDARWATTNCMLPVGAPMANVVWDLALAVRPFALPVNLEDLRDMSESDIVASCKRLGIDLTVQPDFVQGLLKWQVLEDLAQVMGGLCRFASADRPDMEEQCIQFHDTIRRIRVEYLYPSNRAGKYWYLDQLSRIIGTADYEMLKLVDRWEHRTVIQDNRQWTNDTADHIAVLRWYVQRINNTKHDLDVKINTVQSGVYTASILGRYIVSGFLDGLRRDPQNISITGPLLAVICGTYLPYLDLLATLLDDALITTNSSQGTIDSLTVVLDKARLPFIGFSALVPEFLWDLLPSVLQRPLIRLPLIRPITQGCRFFSDPFFIHLELNLVSDKVLDMYDTFIRLPYPPESDKGDALLKQLEELKVQEDIKPWRQRQKSWWDPFW